jgi:hypothetical protein
VINVLVSSLGKPVTVIRKGVVEIFCDCMNWENMCFSFCEHVVGRDAAKVLETKCWESG